MSNFIASMIINQASISIEAGQAKYKAYFVDTTLYLKWQEDVNSILIEKGYEGCIVVN